MPIEVPTPAMLGTVAGIAFIVTILVEVVLRAWQPTAAVKDRFGPFLALGLGILLGIIGAVSQGNDALTGILLGVVAGGGGMGIHDTVDAATT